MQDARATPPRRSRLVLGAALLLALLFLTWFSIGPRIHPAAATIQTAAAPLSSLPPPQSADMARRAAIAAALYAKLQPIMDLLRRARNADYIDWNIGPLTIATSMTGRMVQGHVLEQAALWESDYRFQSDPDGAAGDLAALVALGRAECDTMLGLVLENGFRADAINLIAQNAGSLSTASASDIADIVSPSGAQQSFQQGDQPPFQSIVDPSTGQPFTLTQTPTGFQLTSPTQYKGAPVTLTFPTPTAQ